MKKIKILVVLVCVFFTLALAGCGGKDLAPAKISRDDQRVGGSLSFVYDKNLKTIYIGGQDEVIQYSSEMESKGLDSGCRVGIKVVAPDESLIVEDATLEMNGVNYASGDFLEVVNQQKQRFFNLYPLFSKDTMQVKFEITWQDGTKPQEYRIEIAEGTRFLGKDGKVE